MQQLQDFIEIKKCAIKSRLFSLQVTLDKLAEIPSELRVNGTRGQMWVDMNGSNSTKVAYLIRSGNVNLSCLQQEMAKEI